MKKLLGLIAIASLVLTACRLDARVALDIAEDGTGSAVVEVGIDDELLTAIEAFPGFDADQLVGALGVAGEEGQVEQRREGDTTFFSTTSEFASVSELQEIIDSFGAVDVGSLAVDIDEEGATFEGKVNPAEITATIGGVGLINPTQLEENVSFSIDVALPGELDSHDADQVLPDGTLRWSVAIDAPTDMNATTSLGGGGTPPWLIAVIAAGVVGIGGFLALGRNRDSTARRALEATPEPEAPRGFDEV